MPVFERQRAFHGRGSRDGFLHARDMACGQEVQIAQTDEPLWRVQDGSACVSRGGQANPIQTRSARLSALQRDQTRRNPCRRLALRDFTVCEAHGGIRVLARQGSFSRADEPRRSRRPELQRSKADRRKCRWN